MSFRRDKEKALRWQQWLQRHRDELLACGIPQAVLEDESYWGYFLDHGYFTPSGMGGPLIDVDRMEHDQATRLCLFLESSDYYPGCDTLNRLQYLLKRGRHAKTPI